MEIEEQHPIPQQVSSYQFKLVGDMTLQQFFYVAGGALIALLVYSSTLPSYVKWPFIVVSFLLGIAFAFFPLEDRPLSKWIILFIKAIYSPTLYVWKQTPDKFSYFMPESTAPPQPTTPEQPVPTTGSATANVPAKLESEEKKFLDKVNVHLSGLATQSTLVPPAAKNVQPQEVKNVVVPKTEGVTVEPAEKIQIQPQKEVINSQDESQGFKLTPSVGQKTQNMQSVKFSPDAAPPLPPTKANVVVGQVMDTEGKIVENAILEIRDQEGRPARALRSNKLGHFMIVTPLANGKYEIITEKEGFVFDTLGLETKGEIIPPIAIWAKKTVQNKVPEPIKV